MDNAQDRLIEALRGVLVQQKRKDRIIPIGIDSGDNYYCVNNETGKVYYWSMELDEYYCIAENLEMFVSLFE